MAIYLVKQARNPGITLSLGHLPLARLFKSSLVYLRSVFTQCTWWPYLSPLKSLPRLPCRIKGQILPCPRRPYAASQSYRLLESVGPTLLLFALDPHWPLSVLPVLQVPPASEPLHRLLPLLGTVLPTTMSFRSKLSHYFLREPLLSLQMSYHPIFRAAGRLCQSLLFVLFLVLSTKLGT